MPECNPAQPNQLNDWLELAREVEPLFGPMADLPEFQDALAQAIANDTALSSYEQASGTLLGGIVIDPEHNEIAWLAVTAAARGKGIGRTLLDYALKRLDSSRPINVTTFDASCEAGRPARRLYIDCGFKNHRAAGINPAGLPIVEMKLED